MRIFKWIITSLILNVFLGSLYKAFQFPVQISSSIITSSVSTRQSFSSFCRQRNPKHVLYTSFMLLPENKQGLFSFFNFNKIHNKKHNKNQNSTDESPQPIASLFRENDSEELKKVRIKVAEVQGLLPLGVSELPLAMLLQQSPMISSAKGKSKNMKDIRELSWRVAEPETRYDPSRFSKSSFFAQPLRWMKRNLAIFAPFSWFIIRVLGDSFFGKNGVAQREKRAKQLLRIISQQSPAVIKAGQALSSRSDLLPKEYLQSLQLLQDRVPPFSTQEAMLLFQEETGYVLDEVFELESFQPIAAASIGQVYKGKLKSTGEIVAIKIQRPKCEEVIELDLQVMRWYCQILQHVLSMMGRTVDLVSVIDDFGELLYREIDYRAEAANAQRFAELYGSMPDIYVPKIYPHLSTRKVLTMEWIDGVRLTDVAALRSQNLDPTKLVNALVQCSLRQMLENGFFHADPHGGNLLAMANGKLCYLDFGMVSYVEPGQRYSIIEAVVHLVNRDFTALTELYRRMGFIPKQVNTQPIIEALENALPDVLNASVKDFNFKKMISTLGDIMYKFPFSLPPFYIAIIRCLGVLEGLALQIDSDFRIISDAYPYIASRLLMDASPALQAALQQLLFTEKGKLRWDRLEELLEEAIAIPDYDVATAIEHVIRYLVLPQANTLRIYLAEELVNGFDSLESEAVEMILQYVVSGKRKLAFLKKVLDLRGDGKGLDTLLDKLLILSKANKQSRSTLYSLARILKILRSGEISKKAVIPSNPLITNNGNHIQLPAIKTSQNLSLLMRRMLKEPVLQEWLIQTVGDISEQLSMKMLRRAFNRSSNSTSSATSSSTFKSLFFSEEASLFRREKRLEKRLRHAILRSATKGDHSWFKGWLFRSGDGNKHNKVSSAVSLMTMALFSGLDVLLTPPSSGTWQKKTLAWFQPHMSTGNDVPTIDNDQDLESTSPLSWSTRFDHIEEETTIVPTIQPADNSDHNQIPTQATSTTEAWSKDTKE